MYHYRKTHRRYKSFPTPGSCDFCELAGQPHVIRITKHHYIIPNRVFYDIWEARKVIDHLMIIPKRHVRSLAELTDAEMLDHLKLAAEYEQQGYNIYARAKNSQARSVGHQHTHLIKTKPRALRGVFFLRRPYLFLTLR